MAQTPLHYHEHNGEAYVKVSDIVTLILDFVDMAECKHEKAGLSLTANILGCILDTDPENAIRKLNECPPGN